MPFVSVVMPCLNEEKTIGKCIRKAQIALERLGLDYEIVVSDNGSADSSPGIARSLGAVVVEQPFPGYGATYLKGLQKARGDYIVIADSDNTYDFLELPKFIGKLDEGFDFVIGSRFKGKMEPGSMKTLHFYVGNPVLNSVFNLLFRTSLSDTHCGFRAFTGKAYKKLGLKQEGMEFALEMLVSAHKAGLRIAEAPVNYCRRVSPSKLNSFRDGARHVFFMLSKRLL